MYKSKQPAISKGQTSRSAVYRRARALTAAAEPQPAHADSPLVGAVMTAGIAAVAVTGLAVVVVTLVSKEGGKVQPSGDDGTDSSTHDPTGDPGTTGDTGGSGGDPGGSGGGTGGSGRLAGPGTPSPEQTVGDESLPAEVRGFLHRNIHTSASPAVSAADGSGHKLATARANYRFDGDIRQAAASRHFGFQDMVTLRFEISGVDTPQDAPLAVRVEDLVLSTADVTETNGHAALEFRAVQGNDVLWHWSARVEQGKLPQVSSAAGTTQRIVRQDRDLLIIRALEVPLTYKAPDANGITTVDIIMAVDAAGAKN
jgi:hypothetical protein